MSKLEKADILEMTVSYIHQMQSSQASGVFLSDTKYTTGFNECTAYVIDYITDDGETVNGNDTMKTRLLEHLANVTPTKDLLTSHLHDASNEVAAIERDTNNENASGPIVKLSDSVDSPLIQNTAQEISEYRRSTVQDTSDSLHRTECSRVTGMNQLQMGTSQCQADNTVVTKETAQIATIPKKRKVFGDISNCSRSNVDLQRSAKTEGNRKHSVCTPGHDGILAKPQHKHTRRNTVNNISKPIKKRISELLGTNDKSVRTPVKSEQTVDNISSNTNTGTASFTQTDSENIASFSSWQEHNIVKHSINEITNGNHRIGLDHTTAHAQNGNWYHATSANFIQQKESDTEQLSCAQTDTSYHGVVASAYNCLMGDYDTGMLNNLTCMYAQNETVQYGNIYHSRLETAGDTHNDDYKYDIHARAIDNNNGDNVWRPW